MGKSIKTLGLKKFNLPKTLGGKPKRIVIGLLVVLAIFAVVLAFVISTNMNDKTVFVIDGKNYKKSKVDKLTLYQTEVQKQNADVASKDLYENIKSIVVADKVGVDFQDAKLEKAIQDISVEANIDQNNLDKFKDSIEILAKKEIINETLNPEFNDNYKGYAFDVFFGQHIQYGPTFKPQGLNDPTLIAQDKEYAKQRVNYYKNALSNKTLQPTQVINELKSDRRLSALPKGDASYSVGFGHGESRGIFYEDISNDIRSNNNVGISEIKIGKASVDSKPDNKADMYYYFTLIEKAPNNSGGLLRNKYDSISKELKSEYKGY